MKNKKWILALIALVAVAGLMAGIWFATRQQPENQEPSQTDGTQTGNGKSFTVIVVHADGTEKTFTYETQEAYLGPALVEEGLIVESNSPGMYNTVDGETADWNVNQSYWSFYVGEEYAMQGMDDTLIHDGDTFKLVYTVG